MNVNAFLQKDYENETTFRPKKTNPNKACPERSRMGQFQTAYLLIDRTKRILYYDIK